MTLADRILADQTASGVRAPMHHDPLRVSRARWRFESPAVRRLRAAWYWLRWPSLADLRATLWWARQDLEVDRG